jgi:RNA polymerase sigma-70 factor (ECF subfamily)
MGSNEFSPIDIDDRIRRGDSAAFETLFRTHYDALCSFAVRYTDSSAIAEELVQDVFARVWTDRSRWPSPLNQRAYLFTAVRNRALNVGRRRQLEDDWIEAEAAIARGTDDSTNAVAVPLIADPEAHDYLERAVASLPERCRLVMHLRWRESMSYADIAAIMGISTKGVENQLSRGLRALRRAFGVAH